MTLSICVSENINVFEKLLDNFLQVIEKVIAFLEKIFFEEEASNTHEEDNSDETRAPPALGISVNEELGTTDLIPKK